MEYGNLEIRDLDDGVVGESMSYEDLIVKTNPVMHVSIWSIVHISGQDLW